ncbi:hypothetical protein SAMN05216319_5132 [Duganella sp. CF402]|uniref:hypothetical protein n=1 Tax=unclassified Duganella TaxID=2636909 RepID=UPI0008B1CF5B|nr:MULTISPECIES: hypothetical protein [unclassified Duganella]RZT05572.1 hypothetical protein EV582_3887 [Duganella sp. BK701]SEM99203.1 hypothetical protein SAMN05216319_5132 [Duganella sp. CF402]
MKAAGLTLGLCALLVLGGCGGSSHHDEAPPTTPTTPPVSMIDKFVTAVLAVIGDGAETTSEPQAIDSVAVTMPEDSEPVAVK